MSEKPKVIIEFYESAKGPRSVKTHKKLKVTPFKKDGELKAHYRKVAGIRTPTKINKVDKDGKKIKRVSAAQKVARENFTIMAKERAAERKGTKLPSKAHRDAELVRAAELILAHHKEPKTKHNVAVVYKEEVKHGKASAPQAYKEVKDELSHRKNQKKAKAPKIMKGHAPGFFPLF